MKGLRQTLRLIVGRGGFSGFSSNVSAASVHVCAVVCPKDAAALKSMPARPDVEFIVGNDMADFAVDTERIDSLMFIATGGKPDLMPELFDACPRVRWTHSLFAGVDALAPFIASRLSQSDVPLTNGRGAFSSSLAEYVLAAALHFNKQVPRCVENRQSQTWDKFVMPVLEGKTIGFVGYGNIGQSTARLAKAFGMKVLALRRNPGKVDASDVADETLGPEQKLELFRRSDFVVSVLPGTPETENFCDAEAFGAMKPDAVFISCGRGLVVDEDALADALQSRAIAGAALDVFKVEPLPKDSPLWACENLLLTAHNADFTEDYFELGWQVWVENFERHSTGQALVTPVSKTEGY